MTVVLDKTPSTTGTDDDTAVGTVRYASWGARAAAIALDFLPGVAVIVTMALLAFSTDSGGWLRWVFAVVLAIAGLATIVNRVLLPPLIGWTVGRAVVGIRVTASDGRAVSSIRLLGRDAAHLLDTAALFVGWLWPLWGSRNRTFADLLLRTEVRVVDAAERPTRDVRRIAALVLIAATVVCAAGTGLGYLEVYRQDRAVEQARAEIIEQGPRIVEQVLSYGTKTVTDDFARAQSLVTDDYRPQLTALQQGVQKAGIVNNEYWAVSSAVLSVSKNQAAMLLALQGQRGNGQQDLRFITATVRADFVRAGDKWQVSTLTVLKKPRSNEAAPAPGPPPAPGQPGAAPPPAPGQPGAAPPPAPGQPAPAPGQPNGTGR